MTVSLRLLALALVAIVLTTSAEPILYGADGQISDTGKPLADWVVQRNSRNDEERATAKSALAAIPIPPHEQLWALISHPSAHVRRFALEHLAKTPPTPEQIQGYRQIIRDFTPPTDRYHIEYYRAALIWGAHGTPFTPEDTAAWTRIATDQSIAQIQRGAYKTHGPTAVLGVIRQGTNADANRYINQLIPLIPNLDIVLRSHGSSIVAELRAANIDPGLLYYKIVSSHPTHAKHFIALVPGEVTQDYLIRMSLAKPRTRQNRLSREVLLQNGIGDKDPARQAALTFAFNRLLDDQDEEFARDLASGSHPVPQVAVRTTIDSLAQHLIHQPPELRTPYTQLWRKYRLQVAGAEPVIREAFLADPSRLDLAKTLIGIGWLDESAVPAYRALCRHENPIIRTTASCSLLTAYYDDDESFVIAHDAWISPDASLRSLADTMIARLRVTSAPNQPRGVDRRRVQMTSSSLGNAREKSLQDQRRALQAVKNAYRAPTEYSKMPASPSIQIIDAMPYIDQIDTSAHASRLAAIQTMIDQGQHDKALAQISVYGPHAARFIPWLVANPQLSDTHPYLYIAAASELGPTAAPLLPHLQQLYSNSGWSERQGLARAILRVHPDQLEVWLAETQADTLEQTATRLTHPVLQIRMAAVAKFLKVPPAEREEAIALLLPMITAGGPDGVAAYDWLRLRRTALWIVGEYGPSAKSTLPLLQKISNLPPSQFSMLGELAIMKIDPNEAPAAFARFTAKDIALSPGWAYSADGNEWPFVSPLGVPGTNHCLELRKLGQIAADGISQALAGTDFPQRRQAIAYLEATNTAASIGSLIDHMADEDDRIYQACKLSLLRIDLPALPQLQQAANSKDELKQAFAAELLTHQPFATAIALKAAVTTQP